MQLSEAHLEIRAQARRFADEVIRPVASELDQTERFPAEIYARMAELGLFGITVADADGGAGADALAYALVMEELARGYAAIADQCGLVELVGGLLAQHGSADQKAKYLGPLLRAERRCAYAITEPDAGSDVAAIRTTATPTARGWRLDGAKQWIHNAPVCDFAVVLARTDPGAGRRGMSVFLVERDLPGFEVGAKERKMGQCASPVGALRFDGVELPKDARLGPENRGFHMMMGVLDKGRVGIAALAVGILQAALEAACRLCQDPASVRPGDRAVPGRAVAARRHGQGHGGGAPLDPCRRHEAGWRRARDHGGGDGQVLRERCRGPPYVERGADLRRGRVHPRFRGRAPVSRRQDHPDLRGHQPDPAQHHRAAPVGDMTDAREDPAPAAGEPGAPCGR